MKNIFFAILAFVFLPASVSGQNDDFYIPLQDVSGFNTAQFQDDLNEVAKELVHAFPDTFQSRFRVYSCGFYVHQEKYDEFGYPEAFTYMRNQVAGMSDFYLLFGRESSYRGLYTRFWVELKLPETDDFMCLDLMNPNLRKDLITKAAFIANLVHENGKKDPNFYYLAEQAAMDSLRILIAGFVECCDPGAKPADGCNGCIKTPEEIRSFFVQNKFVAIPIEILENAAKPEQQKFTNNPEIHASLKKFKFDGKTMDIDSFSVHFNESSPSVLSVKSLATDNGFACLADLSGYFLEFKSADFDLFQWAHLWKNPNLNEPDMLFILTKLNRIEEVTNLAFHAYFPIVYESEDGENNLENVNHNEVKKTIENIYFKNKIKIHLHMENKEELEWHDLYNKIVYRPLLAVGIGFTSPLEDIPPFTYLSHKTNIVNYCRLHSINSNSPTDDYFVGYSLSHEFLHGMFNKSYYYIMFGASIDERKNIYQLKYYDKYDGHLSGMPNLLFPHSRIPNDENEGFIQEKHHDTPADYTAHILYKHYLPQKNSSVVSKWELIGKQYREILQMCYHLRAMENISEPDFELKRKEYQGVIKNEKTDYTKPDNQ